MLVATAYTFQTSNIYGMVSGKKLCQSMGRRLEKKVNL